MTLYFSNPGVIDLEASMILGVNAKINENPIGKYGSGLKYAIAVLLRTGHTISVFQGNELHQFHAKKAETRGFAYEQVYLGAKALGFTTHLGCNWEIWQALRELKSNAQDEGGEVTDIEQGPESGQTLIVVSGQGIMAAWENRAKYFLETPKLDSHNGVGIHEGSGVYLQGILVADWKTAWAYNLTHVDLTEDRTVKDAWNVAYAITAAILVQEDTNYVRTILDEKCHEWEFNWYSSQTVSIPNRNLLRFAAKAGTIKSANLRSYANGMIPLDFFARPASVEEHKMIVRGFLVLRSLGFMARDVEVATSLSEGTYSTVHDGELYLGGGVFQMGQRTVTGALLEGMLKLGGNSDYEMREFILDSFIRSLEEKIGVDTAGQTRTEQVADQIEYGGIVESQNQSWVDDDLIF